MSNVRSLNLRGIIFLDGSLMKSRLGDTLDDVTSYDRLNVKSITDDVAGLEEFQKTYLHFENAVALPENVREFERLHEHANGCLDWLDGRTRKNSHQKYNRQQRKPLKAMTDLTGQILELMRSRQPDFRAPHIYDLLCELSVYVAEEFRTKKTYQGRESKTEDLHTDEKMVAAALYLVAFEATPATVISADWDILRQYDQMLRLLKSKVGGRSSGLVRRLQHIPSQIVMTHANRQGEIAKIIGPREMYAYNFTVLEGRRNFKTLERKLRQVKEVYKLVEKKKACPEAKARKSALKARAAQARKPKAKVAPQPYESKVHRT